MIPLHTYVSSTTSIQSLFVHLFKGSEQIYIKDVWLSSRAEFTTCNLNLPTTDSIFGSMIPGPVQTYTSADTVKIEDENLLRYPMGIISMPTEASTITYHIHIF